MTSVLQSKEKCSQKVRYNLLTKLCPEFSSFTVLLVIVMKIFFSQNSRCSGMSGKEMQEEYIYTTF